MSILHVTKRGKMKTFQLDDGKSNSLHRYVNFDKKELYYIMGKQISGKPINPDGKLGKMLLPLADKLWGEDESPLSSQNPSSSTFRSSVVSPTTYRTRLFWVCVIIVTLIFLLYIV